MSRRLLGPHGHGGVMVTGAVVFVPPTLSGSAKTVPWWFRLPDTVAGPRSVKLPSSQPLRLTLVYPGMVEVPASRRSPSVSRYPMNATLVDPAMESDPPTWVYPA